MSPTDKPLVWLHSELKTPPLSTEARVECGYLLRRLQQGESIEMPHSRPMPAIGPRCHELRVVDKNLTWRVMYRIDADAIVVIEVFAKKTQATPRRVIALCEERLREYDNA